MRHLAASALNARSALECADGVGAFPPVRTSESGIADAALQNVPFPCAAGARTQYANALRSIGNENVYSLIGGDRMLG